MDLEYFVDSSKIFLGTSLALIFYTLVLKRSAEVYLNSLARIKLAYLKSKDLTSTIVQFVKDVSGRLFQFKIKK